MDGLSDADLARYCLQGKALAWRELVRRLSPQVFRLSLGSVGHKANQTLRADEELDSLAQDRPGPEREAASQEDTAQVLAAVDRLAAQDRALIDLRYREGNLSAEDTARFERDLAEPAVARAFAEALLLRELLMDLPPDQPPEALLASLLASIPAGLIASPVKTKTKRLAGWVPAWLQSTTRLLQGSTMVVAGAAQASQLGYAWQGLSTVRYALGPLQALPRSPKKSKPPKRPLWRRLLGRRK